MTKKPETVTHNPSINASANRMWLIPLAVIVLCGLSFYSGTAYEKGHVRSTANVAASGRFGPGGGFGGRFAGQRPNIGDVTAVSANSVTITDNFSGSSKSFSISSATTVTNNGQSAAVSDIQTGQTVRIRTGSSTSTQATAIDINPSFGGGQQNSSSGTSSGTGSTSSGSSI